MRRQKSLGQPRIRGEKTFKGERTVGEGQRGREESWCRERQLRTLAGKGIDLGGRKGKVDQSLVFEGSPTKTGIKHKQGTPELAGRSLPSPSSCLPFCPSLALSTLCFSVPSTAAHPLPPFPPPPDSCSPSPARSGKSTLSPQHLIRSLLSSRSIAMPSRNLRS